MIHIVVHEILDTLHILQHGCFKFLLIFDFLFLLALIRSRLWRYRNVF